MKEHFCMRLGYSVIMMVAASFLWTASATAAELVMYRRDGCPWCAAWDRVIGPIYAKTSIGQRVPIRFVDLETARAAISLIHPIRITPTFVLVEAGQERGRIEGYPGEDFFWGLLETLMRQLPAEQGDEFAARAK
jgi:hypothetical protein